MDIETERQIRDLNSWWEPPHPVRPAPPPYRRRQVADIVRSVDRPKALIQVLRGPRQVGKTTALYQVVADLLTAGARPTHLLLVRFDLPPLREVGLLPIVRWYRSQILGREGGTPPLLLLDEIHKLDAWDEQTKHVYDTYGARMVVTGSSSVLVAKGQRESLAGRAITVDFPPFLFREVLEAWPGPSLSGLPAATDCTRWFEPSFDPEAHYRAIHAGARPRRAAFRRLMERYYARGGYPRLHSGEVEEDRWADYLTETVFERVLGVDIPELFPVEDPGLLRHIYLEVARRTGQEVAQNRLTNDCNAAGFRTSQPMVGRYLRYLTDALLVREFRRYPLARSRTARVPSKMALTDLGVRHAIFRGAPSLWGAPPEVVGPLVETLAQTVLRGSGIQVHFYRDYCEPGNRRSPVEEVDFVVESLDGRVIPVEVKFRRRVDPADWSAVARFVARFGSPFGVVVTRDALEWRADERVLLVPLLEFLLAA